MENRSGRDGDRKTGSQRESHADIATQSTVGWEELSVCPSPAPRVACPTNMGRVRGIGTVVGGPARTRSPGSCTPCCGQHWLAPLREPQMPQPLSLGMQGTPCCSSQLPQPKAGRAMPTPERRARSSCSKPPRDIQSLKDDFKKKKKNRRHLLELSGLSNPSRPGEPPNGCFERREPGSSSSLTAQGAGIPCTVVQVVHKRRAS